MAHSVTAEELRQWVNGKWLLFASSRGNGSNKSLRVNPARGFYLVHDRDNAIYDGADVAAAIAAYNDAP